MIRVSNEFKKNVMEDHRNYLIWITMTLKNGVTLNLDNSHIWEKSLKIEEGVSSSSELTLGSCIINKLTFTLNNIYDEFSAYDFSNAELTLYLGLEVNEKIERFVKGKYIVEEAQYDGSTVTLECLDYMSKLDVDYQEVSTIYPASLEKIINDICMHCKVNVDLTKFDNKKMIVSGRPDDKAVTCRQMLVFCAQMSCCFGRMDCNGTLKFDWFNQHIFESKNNLDGGFFDNAKPYMSGNTSDAGGFEDYSKGASIDAGTFQDLDKFHHLYSFSSFSASTDDVVITGINVTEEFTETEKDKKQSYLYGMEGYVLSVDGNKLVQKGMAKSIAEHIGAKIIGMKFRPISAQVLSDPTIEAGDLAYVTDRRSNTYNCLITNMTFSLGESMNVACNAETPSRNSAKQYSELTQAIVEARQAAHKQASSLSAVMAQSFGVFKSEEAQDDGSVVYYMHDKPTMEKSMKIWKFSTDTFEVSMDGGTVWEEGLDANGDAVVNIMSAIGINCDWIREGTLTLGGASNQNGKLEMLDENDAKIGQWDNNGIRSTTHYVSENANEKQKVDIYNGQIIFSKENENLAYIGATSNGMRVYPKAEDASSMSFEINSREIRAQHENMILSSKSSLSLIANKMTINGYEGKTGTAEFSDGSYMKFINGILVSGRTAEGGEF